MKSIQKHMLHDICGKINIFKILQEDGNLSYNDNKFVDNIYEKVISFRDLESPNIILGFEDFLIDLMKNIEVYIIENEVIRKHQNNLFYLLKNMYNFLINIINEEDLKLLLKSKNITVAGDCVFDKLLLCLALSMQDNFQIETSILDQNNILKITPITYSPLGNHNAFYEHLEQYFSITTKVDKIEKVCYVISKTLT